MPVLGLSAASSLGVDCELLAGDAAEGLSGAGRKGLVGGRTPAVRALVLAASRPPEAMLEVAGGSGTFKPAPAEISAAICASTISTEHKLKACSFFTSTTQAGFSLAAALASETNETLQVQVQLQWLLEGKLTDQSSVSISWLPHAAGT